MLEAAISKLAIHGKTAWRICVRGLEKRSYCRKARQSIMKYIQFKILCYSIVVLIYTKNCINTK